MMTAVAEPREGLPGRPGAKLAQPGHRKGVSVVFRKFDHSVGIDGKSIL